MSFGTSVYSLALEIAVEDAWDAGILMVGALGNSGGAVEYPAAFPEVMAVAATGTDAQLTDFSNTGDTLEIAAPGEKIKTAGFFGGSTVTQGTSIATPHVTGAASLLWQKDPSKSAEFIRQLLVHSTKNIENTDDCGLLDVEFALSIYDDFAANWSDEGLVVTRPERLQENDAAAQTFEEIDDDEAYVEGRWTQASHEATVTLGSTGKGFTTTEKNILKAGVIYQDQTASTVGGSGSHKTFPEWHGYYRYETNNTHVNYMAAYELVQKIAISGGDVSSFTINSVKGFTNTASFNRIKSKFSSTGFGGKAWGTILSSFNYNSQSTTTKKKYRQLFIYGMAAHILADTFAHSAIAPKNGKHYNIKHTNATYLGADNVGEVQNRYICAKYGVEETMWNASASLSYGWIDFAIAGYYGETVPQRPLNIQTFYLANMLQHATNNNMPSSLYNAYVETVYFMNYVASA